MLGYIARVRKTGRHDVDLFPYAVTIDAGVLVAGSGPCETRHRAIFMDSLDSPSKFAFASIYDPEEIESWIGRVSHEKLAEFVMLAQA